jgi:uncharacterized protein (DUF1778 family)
MARHSPGQARPPYTMRIGDDERRIVAAAAALRGEALAAYIRRVALLAARRDLTENTSHE